MMNEKNDNGIKIAILETQMKNIEKKIDDGFHDIHKLIDNHLKSIDEKFNLVDKKIDDKFSVVDKRIDKRANKWVEYVLIFVGTSAGAIIIGAIVNLILKQP